MADAPFTGLTGAIKTGPHATAVAVAYISGVDLSLDKDIIEVIQFGNSFKEKVPAIKDWTAKIDGTAAFSSAGTQKDLYDAYDDGTEITLGVYLSETTYFEGTALVKSLNISGAPDDKFNLSCDLEGTGAVTLTVPA